MLAVHTLENNRYSLDSWWLSSWNVHWTFHTFGTSWTGKFYRNPGPSRPSAAQWPGSLSPIRPLCVQVQVAFYLAVRVKAWRQHADSRGFPPGSAQFPLTIMQAAVVWGNVLGPGEKHQWNSKKEIHPLTPTHKVCTLHLGKFVFILSKI